MAYSSLTQWETARQGWEIEGKAMNQFKWYSEKYNCSIADAICDRENPMNEQECVAAFIEAAGREPTATEVSDMRPSGADTCLKLRSEFDSQYQSIYG